MDEELCRIARRYLPEDHLRVEALMTASDR